MTTPDSNTWAAAALRETLRQCVLKLTARLERVGRANAKVDALRVEAREQIAQAAAIREDAKRAGLL